MRFNAKELACVAQEKSSYFDFESSLFVKEKPEGIFKKSKAFVERLFRLKGNILFYFKGKEKSSDVAGVYVLERCCVQLEEDDIDDTHLYCFSIVFEAEPTLNHVFLGSTEEQTRDRWIELLHIASFECMKFQLDMLRDQIRSKTGKDPALQSNETYLALSTAANNQDVVESTCLEMGIQCKGLPLDQCSKHPDTFVTLHYFSSTSKEQWAYHGRTEIIEKNTSPNFVSVMTFRNFDTITLKTKLKLSLRVIKERMTNTAVTMGTAEFSLMEVLTTPTMSVGFTLRSSKYDEVGTVIVTLWLNSNSSNKRGTRVQLSDMEAKLFEELPSQSHLGSMGPCCVGIDTLFLTGRVVKTFRFPVTGPITSTGLLVNEHMMEFKHAFLLPFHFLKMLIEDERQKILALRNLGKLRDKYESIRSSIIDFSLSILINYEQQMKFFSNKRELSFKPSIKKSHKEVELVPTNLHLQSMYVSSNIHEQCFRYDVITVGAFTAGAHKYKHGGVRRLASQLNLALSKEEKGGSRMEHCAKLLRLFEGLKEEIFTRCNVLCSSAVKGKIELVRDAFKVLDQRVNKLLRKCDEEIVTTGATELCSAQFASASPNESLQSFDSLRDASEAQEVDDEQNGGSEGGSRLIEAWMWNGADYVKGANEEPFDMVRLNTEAALVSVRGRLQELFQQSEDEAVLWLDKINPQVFALRRSVEMLVERSKKALNFLVMQDIGSNLPLHHSLKCRRDVVFCQAITTATAGFLSKLSCLVASMIASKQHSASSSSSSSSSSLSSTPHRAQKIRLGAASQRMMSSSSSSSLQSLPSSSPAHQQFFSRTFAIYARIGVLMQFESLLSCYGDEMCMLEDHSEAIKELMKVKIRLRPRSATTVANGTATNAEEISSDFIGGASSSDLPTKSFKENSASRIQTSGEFNSTDDRTSLLSNSSTNSASEDRETSIDAISLGSLPKRAIKEEAPVNDSIDYQIVGSRENCEVIISMPQNIFEDIKSLCSQRNETASSKIRESFAFHLVPVIFTIGINEQATLAERFFSVELQEELNKENFQRLNNYYKDFCSLPEDLKGSDIKGLNSAMQLLQQNVLVSKKSKNVEVLQLAADICKRMDGIRYTSCKSAKDRTAMSVTLEEVTILKREHDLSADLFNHALDALRSEGVRRDNTYKNTGVRKYAFNSIQLLSIPRLYRPPKGTFGNLES